jgi:alpha-D-xyloside xylohydrolase
MLVFLSQQVFSQIPFHSPNPSERLLNDVVDISSDFRSFTHTYYCADRLSSFDPQSGQGTLRYVRYEYSTRFAFNNMVGGLKAAAANEFPGNEYAESPELPFSLEFVSPRTIRIRASSRFQVHPDEPSLMLVGGTVRQDRTGWTCEKIPGGYRYTSRFGAVVMTENPWRITIEDAQGRVLTQTYHMEDTGETFTPVLPFSFVRRASDYSTSYAAVFRLSPNEGIFGCGESFTEFNKRGQKVVLFTHDGNGVQNETMYKPIPFYLSSRGYGVFMHTSSPITCDFGKYYSGANTMMIGDDQLDLFFFLGSPKDILHEYTNLTGKAAMPPLWSFGFWMSRITYFSEKDGRTVAARLRENRIPCDVIHFDTGWFETDWRCDYQFSKSRFEDPAGMIADLKKKGFRVCLWQLPYFVPKNQLFPEILEKGLFVRDRKGNLPYEDAVLDFSNPQTVQWYQDKLAGLLRQGVSVIKVDFGEAAPLEGIYASGRTGFYEHNLYPLRYNKAAAEITREITGDTIIWARSAWAGSQRYPLHWGGDPANTDSAMAATLRGGLSLGLCGFSFWSHDMGGFVKACPEELYRRWAAFGFFSSHSRSHGTPPTEPWEYSEEFLNGFRKTAEMRYRLMPYLYAQAKDCTERGLPMLRALFVEFPEDPGSWRVDDEYLLGSDILAAPLLEAGNQRNVYLPPGEWIDYQTGRVYAGGWHRMQAGEVPILLLVRNGAVIPQIEPAQSTAFLDWSKLELVVFAADRTEARGLVCLPEGQNLKTVTLTAKRGQYELTEDPFAGRVQWSIRQAAFQRP